MDTCPRCGRGLPSGVTRCWKQGCDFVLGLPNIRGEDLETMVDRMLVNLSPYSKFQVERHPRVTLQNGEVVIPDFDLQVILSYEHRYYFIECQHRKKSSKSILHKIQHIRNKFWRKTFIFVTADKISEEMDKSLKAEGVPHMTFFDFCKFIERLEKAVQSDTCIEEDYIPPSMPSI